MNWKLPHRKKYFSQKGNLRIKDVFGFALGLANGLRYPRWGGRRDAIRLGICWGVEKCLESRQNPQRRVHALLGGVWLEDSLAKKNDIAIVTKLLCPKILLRLRIAFICQKSDNSPAVFCYSCFTKTRLLKCWWRTHKAITFIWLNWVAFNYCCSLWKSVFHGGLQ